MKVREYLEKHIRGEVTFIKARAREDARTPFYHAEYQTTPINSAETWLKPNNAKILDSVILNDRQMPIDWLSGAPWGNLVRSGWLKCLLIISQEDFELLIPDQEQRNSIEKFIEKEMNNEKDR